MSGVPTPVALVGADVLRAWLGAHPRFVRTESVHIDEIVGSFLVAASDALRTALLARVERLRGDRVVPDGKFERELWFDVTGDVLLGAGDVDGQTLLEHFRRGESPPSGRLLAIAQRVLGPGTPAILVDHPDFDAAVRAAVALAEAAPAIAIAIATTAERWHTWHALPDRARARTLIRGCLPLETREPTTNVIDDEARSAAERRLFDALEAHPTSQGLFVLNHELDIRFGSRALEIDLACATLGLAVEIDGYFHFLDADAYRRDRRKDIALQREGYFVVRVLAEDVMARLDEVVLTVHEALALRRERKAR